MQALPERIHDTEVMVEHLLNEVLPRLEHFRESVAHNRSEKLKTRRGVVELTPASMRKGLLEKWIPAAREQLDLANDAYYDIKHKASGRVVSLLQGDKGGRNIHRLNSNLTDLRDRLDHLEDSLETQQAVSRITDISPSFSAPVTREIEALKLRIEQLELNQQKHEKSTERQFRMQKVFNQSVDRKLSNLKEKQASLDPKLRYLDGRTSERSRELRQIHEEMTRFNASLELIKENQDIPVLRERAVPLRQAAALAALLTTIGLSGVIVYQSVTGESPVFGDKKQVASEQGERVKIDPPPGVKYLSE